MDALLCSVPVRLTDGLVVCGRWERGEEGIAPGVPEGDDALATREFRVQVQFLWWCEAEGARDVGAFVAVGEVHADLEVRVTLEEGVGLGDAGGRDEHADAELADHAVDAAQERGPLDLRLACAPRE